MVGILGSAFGHGDYCAGARKAKHHGSSYQFPEQLMLQGMSNRSQHDFGSHV